MAFTRRQIVIAAAMAVAPKPGNYNPYAYAGGQPGIPQTNAGLAQINWSDLKQLTIQLPQGIVNLSAEEVWTALNQKR